MAIKDKEVQWIASELTNSFTITETSSLKLPLKYQIKQEGCEK